MASIRDITTGNSYTGNSNLGGRFSQGVTIDSTPLARLAAFTYYRDQNFWEQKQKDDKAAAQEIADMTAFDVNSPMKGYSEHLKTKVNEIRDFIRDNPNALNYNKDPKGFQKFKQLEGDFQNARKAANTSEVIYNARKTAADKAATPEEKAVLLSGLDLDVNKLFKDGVDGALNNSLNSAPTLKVDAYTLPDIPLTERISVIRNANDVEIDTVKFADPNQALANADSIMFGFRKPIDKTTERWKSLTPEEQKQEEAEFNLTSAPRISIQKTADSLNGLLQDLKAKNPNIKVADITPDMMPTETVGAIINSAKLYNENIDKLNARTGEKYKHLNLDDGLTGSEVLVLNAFQKNKNSLFSETDKKVQQTDNAIQKDQQAIGWYNAKTGRIQEDRLAKAAGVPGQVASSAKSYAEGLMNKLNSLKDAGGVIGKDKLSKLTADELKYLGKGETTENKFTLTPLSLKTISSIVIDNDGNILTYSGGTGKSLGSQTGPSINISTVATNKLGDEMVTSTGKEGFNFNNLIPLYNQQEGQPAPTPTTTAPTSTPADIRPLKATGQYIMVVEKGGVRYGKKKDGTIEIIK